MVARARFKRASVFGLAHSQCCRDRLGLERLPLEHLGELVGSGGRDILACGSNPIPYFRIIDHGNHVVRDILAQHLRHCGPPKTAVLVSVASIG